MEFIGITGGVGAGKSRILKFIEENYNAKVLLADEVAHTLMEPGKDCYEKILKAFPGEDILGEDGAFDAGKLAAVIFSDREKRERINGIVHPAVKEEILGIYQKEKEKGRFSYFILEAALLIEEGYDTICDRLWYIDTSREIRRQRLKINRGYSDGKIDSIFESQLPEETYRKYAALVIDNNGTPEEAVAQVKKAFPPFE